MNAEINSLEIKVKTDSQQAASSLNALAASLEKIKAATKGGTGLAAVANQLTKINTALTGLDSSKVAGVKTALSGLEGVKATTTATNVKLAESNIKVNKSFSAIKTAGVLYMFRRAANLIGNWIKESNDYVENLNLFTVAMGEYADSAQEYAEKVNTLMGIDPSDWMRTQGVFQTLATGFGIASDKAAVMSQNLTQLSYDLASFYNLSVEDATQKVQSAFSGELEPVRRLGFDLSQARLEAIAAAQGIDKAVSSMTQAEKSQLRYYALMTQVTQVHGDMARTLESPANQLRVFQAAATQAGRALGNVFIPMLNAILPVATAVLGVVKDLANSLAAVFGFKLTTVDYSGIENGNGAISDSLDEVADSAGGAKKALDNYALSIDELNVISPNKGGGGGGASAFENALSEMDIPTYNFLGALEEKASQLKDVLKEVLETLLLIGGAVGLFSLATALSQAQGLAALLGKLALSTIVVALEFMIAANSIKEYITEKDLWDFIQAAIVVGAGSAILYKMWGPAGAAIGFAVGVVATITGISMAIGEGAKFDSLEVRISQLLAGVFGGLAGLSVAKAAGLDLGKGALVGVAVSTALAITVTNVSAIASGQIKIDSVESAINGILSSAFLGIAGATIMGGPAGFVIGLGVGLVVNVVSAILADQARKNAEAIANAFGDISISIEEMEEGAKLFVDTGIAEKLDEIANSKEKIAALVDEMSELFATINKKIELGVEPVSKEEFEKAAELAETYAREQNIMLTLTIDTLGLGDEITELLTGTNSINSQLTGLAAELKEVVASGFDSGGEWIPDKQAKAQEIYSEMQELITLVEEAAVNAEIDFAVSKFNLSEMDRESVTELLATVSEKTQGYIEQMEAQELAIYSRMRLELEQDDGVLSAEDRRKLEEYAEEVQSAIAQKKLELMTPAILAINEMMIENQGDIIAMAQQALSEISFDLSPLMASMFGVPESLVSATAEEFGGTLMAIAQQGVLALQTNVPEEVRAAASAAYEAMKPAMEDVEAVAREAYKAGETVGQEIVEALDNFHAEGALAGSVDSMLYQMGAALSTSPELYNALATVEGIGAELPANLVLGINAHMAEVNEAVQAGIIPVTETLVANFEAAGIEVPAAWLAQLNVGIGENAEGMAGAGGIMAENVTGGAMSTFESTDYGGAIVGGINSSVESSSGGLQDAGAAAGGHFGSGMMSAVNEFLAGAQLAAQNVADQVGKIINKAFDLDYDFTIKGVPGYASGGYPSAGQIFLAREAGPEMVGSIGGRTAVANNDQIVEAVSAGVYQAVMSAQGNNEGGGMQIAVYLDGKQIEASVRSTQQKRGAVIATGGILNYA